MVFVNARFLTQSITGVQRYALEICRILKKIDSSIRFVAPNNIIHPALAEELGVEVIGRFTGHLWEQLELPIFLKRNGSPLLFSLATTAPIFYKRKIVTIHDLAFLHFPDAHSWKFRCFYRFLIPRVLRSSLHITTVSEFSKNDISIKYNIRRDNISVIYNASSFDQNPNENFAVKNNVILAVGSVQAYKNIETLVAAFNIFKTQVEPGYVLKLVGGLNKNVFKDVTFGEIIKKQGDDVKLTGYLTDTELHELYRSSKCFVFPSLFEGFGIPPLEAMACGCPVIASNATSIPEVCKDGALYFDPYNIKDLSEKMISLVNNDILQKKLIERGLENIQRFSWNKSANVVYKLLKKFE
ncbi:glycosyltransferase family 4 protein [Janthinobacterium sp. RB2P8]|uniref:glycosyltransferase family 4 protein n=1 Tax=Janthinobacterium sp. RB2P8 TaxID=3424191 RepID=UPI003F1F8655